MDSYCQRTALSCSRATGFGLLACVVLWLISVQALSANEPQRGQFLVASENIRDPRFRHSVILITQHDDNGTIGLMINHPTRRPLAQMLPDIPQLQQRQDRLYIGGPIMDGPPLILIESGLPLPADRSLLVFDQIYFTADQELLAIAIDRPRSRFRVYAGYAGWAPGQLESELERDAWLLRQGDIGSIFDRPADTLWQELHSSHGDQRWVAFPMPPALRLIGI